MPNLDELLSKYLQSSLTQVEAKQLSLLVEITPHEVLAEELEKAWKDWRGKEVISEERSQAILQDILQKNKVKRISIFKWVAAACIVLVTSYGLWVMSERKASRQQGSETAVTHDVPAPKETRAVITLANGQKVYLDSANNGTIAQENNVNVVRNEEGAISYQPLAISQQPTANSPISFNTLSNPRGSKVISLTLSDGTKVWLNSESSLKYPIAFNANTREVEITGEAYFEVKHNAKQPFKVHLPNGATVEDIGTSFNINAYNDEEVIKTTLIEGSVRISAKLPVLSSSAVTLKPNQQSVQNQSNPVIRVQNNVDIEQTLAWKNGLFQFTNADIQTVMRQLARWYDIDVVYQGNIPVRRFEGKIQRDLSLADVLEPLAKNQVHFKIEGKKITITP